MTEAEMKEWIDQASYTELLRKWRFDPPGSEWFVGDIGEYFSKAVWHKKRDIGPSAAVAASKQVGWDKP